MDTGDDGEIYDEEDQLIAYTTAKPRQQQWKLSRRQSNFTSNIVQIKTLEEMKQPSELLAYMEQSEKQIENLLLHTEQLEKRLSRLELEFNQRLSTLEALVPVEPAAASGMNNFVDPGVEKLEWETDTITTDSSGSGGGHVSGGLAFARGGFGRAKEWEKSISERLERLESQVSNCCALVKRVEERETLIASQTFESRREVVKTLDLIKRLQMDQFNAIQHLKQSNNRFETDLHRYGSKLNNLRANFLNISVHELKNNNKDLEQDVQLAEIRLELMRAEKKFHCTFETASQAATYHSGLHLLHLKNYNTTVRVYCDMQDELGGWTVIQRRLDGGVDFNQNWTNYKNGFGQLDSNFWLGNRHIHAMTSNAKYALKIETIDVFGRYFVAKYANFSLGSEVNGFALHVGGYTGNLSDALSEHNGMRFSTGDRDQDASSTHCAKFYESGWWFNHCQKANLNGRHDIGMIWFDINTSDWIHLKQTIETSSHVNSRHMVQNTVQLRMKKQKKKPTAVNRRSSTNENYDQLISDVVPLFDTGSEPDVVVDAPGFNSAPLSVAIERGGTI
ncbi:putative protein scabrous [Trichinella spiralis]|uniref:putative protein scabrous n=1 Tax=Trichinella spiralis TaxID=6334 RepID=UPI0001EFC5A0|nr:putative protein scabrous [Trichinella spiralis]